jgi:hypothetical protein
VYDNPGRVALLALHTLCRMCKLQVLKAVEKFDSRRLHQIVSCCACLAGNYSFQAIFFEFSGAL